MKADLDRRELKMKLNEPSAEEALEKGVITDDPWNDELCDTHMPVWKRALEVAGKYHEKVRNTYTDKTQELRRGTDKPYIVFIQKLLNILINEANLLGDDILTVAALYNILEMTDCDRTNIVRKFGEEIVEQIEALQTEEGETFGNQLARLVSMDDQKGALVTYVFLAVKLLEERVTDLCPFEDWREDVPHYKNLSDELRECGLKFYREKKWDVAVFLSEKILEQLDKNMELSRNCNKTAEELYSGWE